MIPLSSTGDDSHAPALVVVVNNPVELSRAGNSGWYRIPVDRAPSRLAAEYLAFYQTGAFEPGDRWLVRWFAPVLRYHLASRLELIPEEPAHQRAGHRYYKISVGPLAPLPRPIPSARLRRITFIPTTMERLCTATEINQLWIKSSAQERLWEALRLAGLDAERQYPLNDDLPQHVADFALIRRKGRVAVFIDDDPPEDLALRQGSGELIDYLLVANGWTAIHVMQAEIDAGPAEVAARLATAAQALGDPAY